MRKQINKRTRKAVINSLTTMINKYGFDSVKYIINKFFTAEQEKRKLEKEIKTAEKSIHALKSSLKQNFQ